MLYVVQAVAMPIVCQKRKLPSIALALLLAACARTGLDPADVADTDATGVDAQGAGGKTATEMPTNGAQAGSAPTLSTGGTPQVQVEPPQCEPHAEKCNGRDDDCNGAVDDLAPGPCVGGGFRFCVAGKWSECPRRCDVCVPGSVRICQNSFCSFWGEQECAADGQGFGHCREAKPPPECAATADRFQSSKELEQCCLDNGYCCLDEHDLDGDGDRREMLGACGDVVCQ